MIYTVVSTDSNPAINWQCELLEYSWSKSRQPGELIRLVARGPEGRLPTHRHARVVETAFTNIDPETGDNYPPYNRLYSMQEWLETENPIGTVLFVDPDMIFRAAVGKEVEPGKPSGQHWHDFGFSDRKRKVTEQISQTSIDCVQPLTWPALIHTSDLKALMPRWIELTRQYRQITGGWEDDMFAFTVAAAELGLVFDFRNLSAWTHWPEARVGGAPIIHFCQPISNSEGEVLWSKNRYERGQPVMSPESATSEYCRDLLQLVDEYARLQRTFDENSSSTIFIAIAAYCEPELISTIESCLQRAFRPENLRFGICLQYDNEGGELMGEDCLNRYRDDDRFQFVKYDYRQSQGGCWARNICQSFYAGEGFTLQVDAHTQLREGWDMLLIDMMKTLPSEKPLITGFPPLYTVDTNGQITLRELDTLSQISTTVAAEWNPEGWIHHVTKKIPENSATPRATRFLSGAFVFTLGQWNHEVHQDPRHFYTGEEFALALRSFTCGYDLFNPTEIVAWHRLHPEKNRKFWHDNADEISHRKHAVAVARLRTLMAGDPENELAPYGPGTARSLEDFSAFTGLDFDTYTASDDARNGVPPHYPTFDAFCAATRVPPRADIPDTEPVEVNVILKDRDPLHLACDANHPMLGVLGQALMAPKSQAKTLFLQLGDNLERIIYFKSSELQAIETSPPINLAALIEQVSVEPVENETPADPVFNDSLKAWIWNSIHQGRTKSDMLNELVGRGFDREVAAMELGLAAPVPAQAEPGPPESTPSVIRYTETGIKHITMPRGLFERLQAFYESHIDTTNNEHIPDFITNRSDDQVPSELIELPRYIKIAISHQLKPIMERWSALALESTAVYGIRRYHRGTQLKVHIDRSKTHIISGILNIAQSVDRDWPLVIDDHQGQTHHVVMQPGDLILYEGATLRHGRPLPLEGDYFCNVFVHFKPASENPPTGDNIVV
ncbi:MAG: GlcNAc-transferase family protein [Pseudomonadota bacterium]